MKVEKVIFTVMYSLLATVITALVAVLAVKWFPFSIALIAVFAAAFSWIWRNIEL